MAAKMTSKQRLLTTIRHEEPDIVPVAPKGGNFFKQHYGCACWMHELKAAEEFDFDPLIYLSSTVRDIAPLRRRYIPLKNYIHSWAEDYEQLDDVTVDLKIQRFPKYTIIDRTIHTPAGDLTDQMKQPKPDAGYGDWPYPEHVIPLLKGKEDMEKLPYILTKPDKKTLLDIPEIINVIGERGLLMPCCNCAVDFNLVDGFGPGEAMMMLGGDKPLFKQFLKIFHDHTMLELKAILEAGAEAVMCTWFNASLSMGWGPKHFKELFAPLIKEQTEMVHSYNALTFYYDDGKMKDSLETIADCGVDVILTLCPPPVGDINLAEAKKLVGDKVCLNGNIDLLYVIKMGTPEQIREAVRHAILDAAKGGGFILGTSDAIREAPLENVRAYFEAGREYGDYNKLGG